MNPTGEQHGPTALAKVDSTTLLTAHWEPVNAVVLSGYRCTAPVHVLAVPQTPAETFPCRTPDNSDQSVSNTACDVTDGQTAQYKAPKFCPLKRTRRP